MAIVDSLFIKSSVGGEGCAINGLRRAKGLTVHAAVDARRHVLAWRVERGNAADARVAHALLPQMKSAHPGIELVLGDMACSGQPLQALAQELGLRLDARASPLPRSAGFVPQPLRWRIEQVFSWLVKWRRIARVWAYGRPGFAHDFSWCVLGLELRRSGV